ncbi:hypothetical protein chiPu_0012627 [Chiloscyllium punctatum]|uniref:Uncharacterized protein n=1 Tax=Chiloscyllium punctatum TaxID=137246 RepID=A0A401SUR8_CHIPU|nr:hypothetical protein [Chiloscyllium punctatum]
MPRGLYERGPAFDTKSLIHQNNTGAILNRSRDAARAPGGNSQWPAPRGRAFATRANQEGAPLAPSSDWIRNGLKTRSETGTSPESPEWDALVDGSSIAGFNIEVWSKQRLLLMQTWLCTFYFAMTSQRLIPLFVCTAVA